MLESLLERGLELGFSNQGGQAEAEEEQDVQPTDLASEAGMPEREVANEEGATQGQAVGAMPGAGLEGGEPMEGRAEERELQDSGSAAAGDGRRRRLAGSRIRAELALEVPGGVLRYYETTKLFTATCANPAHGRCVLSRTSEAGRRKAQGRPLGLLMSWLARGEDAGTKEEHWSKDLCLSPSATTRAEHREVLEGLIGSQDFLERERAQEAGESKEPDGLA